ncbi:MAG: hypothetical protein AAGM22_24265 [Acidobacteriota bacterium]
MRRLAVHFGTPDAGWLPVELRVGHRVRAFHASHTPHDPVAQLVEALLCCLEGRSGEVRWQLEPAVELWTFRTVGDACQLVVSLETGGGAASSGTAAPGESLTISGPAVDICTPAWRALRRLESDLVWSSPGADRAWGWPFPKTTLADLGKRIRP